MSDLTWALVIIAVIQLVSLAANVTIALRMRKGEIERSVAALAAAQAIAKSTECIHEAVNSNNLEMQKELRELNKSLTESVRINASLVEKAAALREAKTT
jgi:transposase-like protein